MDKLIYTDVPAVTLATNTYIRVPTILQFDDTPLIEVINVQTAGFTTSIPIYHSDGTYLAKVVGSRIVLTDAGKKAGVSLEHPDKMTVCRIGGRIAFEIRRDDAAALKTSAELYTPNGYFVRVADTAPLGVLDNAGKALQIRGITMRGNLFKDCRIGVWIQSNGSVSLGVA